MAGVKGRSGGARPNSGPRRLSASAIALRGGRLRGARRFQEAVEKAAAAPMVPVRPVAIPEDLPDDQRAVWEALAPHATTERTLTPATAWAFRDLCEAIVVKRSMLAQILADGLTSIDVSVDGAGVEHQKKVAHPLLARHQGMMVRVEAGMARFLVNATGKPAEAGQEQPANPLVKFLKRG